MEAFNKYCKRCGALIGNAIGANSVTPPYKCFCKEEPLEPNEVIAGHTREARIHQLKAMHELMLNANDEEIYMTWIYTMPDEPSEEDFIDIAMKRALNQVQSYLYKGDGTYSWATSVLPIINVQKDIDTLNQFVMDAIRACATKKKKIGGLGSVNDKEDCTIMRGTGKNVAANRNKTDKEIENYLSIRCMQNALLTRGAVYETLVRSM